MKPAEELVALTTKFAAGAATDGDKEKFRKLAAMVRGDRYRTCDS
jgi:hypothetical protein